MLQIQTINLDYIRTFVVVGQSKDLKSASTKLKIDVSNVSRHLKALESIYETRLINRRFKGIIELSEDGQKLFEGFEKAYNMMMLTEKNYTQEKSLNSCKLSIGVSYDMEMEQLEMAILKFKRKYPDIILKIVNLPIEDLFDKLTQLSLDFVIDELSPNIKKSSEIVTKEFSHEVFCLAYSKEHFPQLDGDIKAFSGNPFILPISSKKERGEIETFLSQHHIEYQLTMEITNYFTAKEYAKKGLGIALLPKKIVQDSNLEVLDVDFEKIVYVSYIDSYLSPSAEKFLDIFK